MIDECNPQITAQCGFAVYAVKFESLFVHIHTCTTGCFFKWHMCVCIIGERERANLVLQLGRGVVIYIYIVRRRRAPGVYDVNIP